MWCVQCQLDVPALAVPEEPGVVRCAFCRCELAGKHESAARIQESEVRVQGSGFKNLEPESRHQELDVSVPVPDEKTRQTEQVTEESDQVAEEARPSLFVPPPPVDEWESDLELRRVERLVNVLRQSHERGDALRIADGGFQIDEQPVATTPQPALRSPQSQPQAAGLAAWACLTAGLMAFVCGGVLVIWSFAADRADLWSLGLPLTLAGQVGLVLGLLLQLDGLSQSSRRTEETLTELDSQLGQLRGVTAMVSSTHSGPAHSFYAHLTEGASPQILLADLKGQLDLLAQQMARQRKAA
jgi:hypothetical protein